MKLVAVMPIWKRPLLTSIVLRQWHEQIHRLRGQIELHLICVGSEGKASSALLSGYTDVMSYVEHANDPLNRKWSAGVEVAKYMNPDGLMIVGSDDLLSDSLFLAWKEKLSLGLNVFGLKDLYFFDASAIHLKHWPGYGPGRLPHREGEPVGLARCYSRHAMQTIDWQLWPYNPQRNNSLDFASMARLRKFGFEADVFTLAELGAKAVDIKTDEGIITFERIPFDTQVFGQAALDYLADLADASSLHALTTQWRTAA